MSDALPAHPSRAFLFTLVVVTALGPLAMQIFVPALPIIQTDFQVSAGTAQLALSLSMVAIALATLIYGPLSDRYGRRPVMLFGLSVFLVGSAVCAFASSIDMLIVGRIVQAIGGTAGMVLARAVVRDVYAQEKVASVLATITLAMVVAPMFAPAIGGVLTDVFGWRANFAFVGLFSVGVLILVQSRLAETASLPPTHAGFSGLFEAFGLLMRSGVFRGYAFAGAFGLSAFFSFISAAPYLMVNVLGHPAADYGIYFIAISLSFMAGNAVAARYSTQAGGERMIVLGCAIAVAGVAALFALTMAGRLSALTIFAPTAVMVFGNGLAMANLQAGALGVFPRSAGTASGLSGFLQMSIAAGFAQCVGALQNGTAYPMAAFMMVSVVLSLASFLYALRAGKAAAAEAAP